MLRRRRQRTSFLLFVITDKWCWPGRLGFGRACRTSTPCRPRCEVPLPGSAASRGRGAAPRMRLPPSGSRCCGWAGVLSRHGTSPPTMARRSISWQWRPRRWGFWVDQASLMWSDSSGTIQKDHFSGELPSRFVSGKLEGWSLWRRNVLVKLVSRCIWTQDRLARLRGGKTIAASSATMVLVLCFTAAASARPCRQSGTCKFRRRCDKLLALWSHNTGNSSHATFSLAHPQFSQQVHSSSHAQCCGTIGTQTGSWRGTFSWTVPRRAGATSQLGRGGGRRCGEPQVSGLRCSAERRAAWADFARWRGLRRCHGRNHHHGPAHAAHRLQRYHRDDQRAEVQGHGSRVFQSTCLEQASWLPRRGQGNQGQGPRHTARRGGWALFPP